MCTLLRVMAVVGSPLNNTSKIQCKSTCSCVFSGENLHTLRGPTKATTNKAKLACSNLELFLPLRLCSPPQPLSPYLSNPIRLCFHLVPFLQGLTK